MPTTPSISWLTSWNNNASSGMPNKKPNSVAATTILGATAATTAKAMHLDVLDPARPATDQAVAPLSPLRVPAALPMGSVLVLALDAVPHAPTLHPILVAEDAVRAPHLSVPPIIFAIILHMAVDLPHTALDVNFTITQTTTIKNLILLREAINISTNIPTRHPNTTLMPTTQIICPLRLRLTKPIILVTPPKINITRTLNNRHMTAIIMLLDTMTTLTMIGSKITDMKPTYPRHKLQHSGTHPITHSRPHPHDIYCSSPHREDSLWVTINHPTRLWSNIHLD